MDAGVLELHVFQHDPAYEPMRLSDGEEIQPWLTSDQEAAESCPVSLIIPTFYNDTLKARALDYLLAGIADSRCIQEVVLVAADGNVASLERFKDSLPVPVIITSCEPNRRAQTRNVGVKAASSEMLLFLDDDMLLQDWKQADVILSHMLENSYDCSLFPRRNFAKFPLLYDKTRLESVISTWRTGDFANLSEDEFLDPVKDGSPFKTMAFCFPGCFMMISRAAYDQIGGFPEEFEGWGFEDTDFAMRAVRNLNVLNLFRATPPLLHIDHPVSPYKSDEYRKNLQQFSSDYDTLDMDWLCKRVFAGEHFAPNQETGSREEDYLAPVEQVLSGEDLPFPEYPVLRNYRHVIDIRMKRGLDPIPSYITLHGSRGTNQHTTESDYDVLVLFRGGTFGEHFSCEHEGKTLEIENAGLSKFESLAAAPAVHPMRSPFELAKLAQSRVLWGDDSAFHAWRDTVLNIGVQVGLPVWLLSGIGLRLNEDKHGPYVDLYFEAIRKILDFQPAEPAATFDHQSSGALAASIKESSQPTGMPLSQQSVQRQASFDTHLFEASNFEDLLAATRSYLDAELSDWREDMADHKRVFAVQVPEIWAALHMLLQTER